jgi:hypothetical protein
MTTTELTRKLQELGTGNTATVFFRDGQVIRGGMLFNSVQQSGVIIDPDQEVERRFQAHEVAKVWRR